MISRSKYVKRKKKMYELMFPYSQTTNMDIT